eukprot:1321-Heterococcus_DN1.PRE.1
MQRCCALCALAAAAAKCDLVATHVVLLKGLVRRASAAAVCKHARPRTTPHTCMLLAAAEHLCEKGRRPLGTVSTPGGESSRALRCFTRAIDLAQSSSSSEADKANLHSNSAANAATSKA